MRTSVKLSVFLIALVIGVMLLPGTGWAGTTQRSSKHPDGRPAAPASSGTVNTVYFFDDFENGLSKWTESTGYWGTATCDYRSTTNSVSATPVSGSSCPPTDYPANVSASLTMAQSYELNLSGATSPILTFWHKYSFASGCCDWWDYGYVEYSTNYGVTWAKLTNQDTSSPDGNGPGFTGTISSWYPEEFDLTQIPKWNTVPAIMIRFRLWSDGNTPKSWGWLIDDVEVREKGSLNVGLTVSISPSGGGTVTGSGIDCPGTCSELWPANWTLSGREWASEDSTYEQPPAAMSAVPDYPNGGDYAVNADSVLEQATPVSIAGATAPTLSIYTQYSFASGCCDWWDYGYAEYSTDYGVTWSKLSNQDTTSPDGNGPGFNGTVTSWTQEQFDLTQITNWKTLPILVRFRLWSDGNTPKSWGWLIDDPEIYDPATGTKYFGPDTFSTGSLPNFSNVTLTATPSTGYTFGSWTGCNSASGNECTINRYIDRNVTATFTPCTNCNPGITLSPTSLTFSKQPLNTTSKAQSVTATNNGASGSSVNISSIVASPSANFSISANTCGTTLDGGKTCTVSVTYTATALGTQTGTLTFTDTASNNPQVASLTGTGEAPATLTPASCTFKKTPVDETSAACKLTLKNNLSTTLTGVSFSTAGAFAVSTATCGITLAAGKSCMIDVTFTPTATGTVTGTLTVHDSANNSPQTATLTGTGELQATLTPASYTFKETKVGDTSKAEKFTLKNNLATTLTGVSYSISSGSAEYSIESSTCSTTLNAGKSCTISVTFKPTATGTVTGTLTVHDSANNSPQTATLSGTGD
jgi:hypothetical protein